MNAFTKRMRAQGSDRFLKVGSRLFTYHHSANGQERELSEVLDWKDGTISVLPGYFRGKKHYGFPMLLSAALDRKYAMQSTDEYRRRRFISRAFQELEIARRDFPKPRLDPVEREEMKRAA